MKSSKHQRAQERLTAALLDHVLEDRGLDSRDRHLHFASHATQDGVLLVVEVRRSMHPLVAIGQGRLDAFLRAEEEGTAAQASWATVVELAPDHASLVREALEATFGARAS